MTNTPLSILSDIATETQAAIQHDFTDINPVVGVNQSMRTRGVPADAMTIDCLRTQKRIILILHDDHPGVVNYQFSKKDTDPAGKFDSIPFDELTAKTLYTWISQYFLGTTNP